MKKYILIIMLSFFLALHLISAATVNVINSNYIPSVFESTFGPYSTGSQISWDLVISDPNIANIKNVRIVWDNSWIDAYSNKILNNSDVEYKFLLTVTPFMNHTTEVYLKSEGLSENVNYLLGTYPFNGKQFPGSNCATKQVCSRYSYSYQTICLKYRTGRCISSKTTRTQGDCLVYRNVKVCSN